MCRGLDVEYAAGKEEEKRKVYGCAVVKENIERVDMLGVEIPSHSNNCNAKEVIS